MAFNNTNGQIALRRCIIYENVTSATNTFEVSRTFSAFVVITQKYNYLIYRWHDQNLIFFILTPEQFTISWSM